ncbi:hypothetical protein VTK73DRAFT_4441 [Phialemonium thermophilum]|uniref:FAD-binding domain-containing protein n=1 Tax=Phialemonium thermophilum TaxID=223376 RepID=A0ABR3WTH8_9PEZI
MPISHVLVLGAGPAGLAAALSLSQQPDSPFRITVLEIRSAPGSLGGAIHLTPLALRYLDRLSDTSASTSTTVGARVRSLACPIRAGIDLVSLRTGASLGTRWHNTDAVRVRRRDLVASLTEAARARDNISLRYDVRAVGIRDEEEQRTVFVDLEGGETVAGDVLLGCDGLHSVARSLYVDPSRQPTYSGRASAYAFARLDKPGSTPVVRGDATLVSGRYGSLLAAFCTPERDELFVAAVMGMPEVAGEGESGATAAREGWRARGDDKMKVREDILRRFHGGGVTGLTELIQRADDWTLFPVYQLPPGGRWSQGRVALLGDAAHAMPPQGESTGVAIEDGVLMARILRRHNERTVAQLFDDYEKMRRPPVDKLYRDSVWRWNTAIKEDAGWFGTIVMEWMTYLFLWFMHYRAEDHFASDVEKLELPQ